MNYFGHATLAIQLDESPAFVLGSMLPDLAPMAGCALAKENAHADVDLIAGLAFHIRTDSIFHQTPTFSRLNHQALRAFSALGIRKGPARACAHIGVEMLIDAQLALNASLERPYRAALRFGANKSEALGCLTPGSTRRLAGLLHHLDEKGLGLHTASVERFTFRLERALAPRARLSPTGKELSAIVGYLCKMEDIPGEVDELMLELSPLLQPRGRNCL